MITLNCSTVVLLILQLLHIILVLRLFSTLLDDRTSYLLKTLVCSFSTIVILLLELMREFSFIGCIFFKMSL